MASQEVMPDNWKGWGTSIKAYPDHLGPCHLAWNCATVLRFSNLKWRSKGSFTVPFEETELSEL